MGGSEALALHGRVRVEEHEQVVATRDDGFGHAVGAAVAPQTAVALAQTVVDLHVVVRALVVRLDLEVGEHLHNNRK